MRRTVLGLACGLGLLLVSSQSAQSQTTTTTQGLGADPFSLYYGWYLPNQAYQAAQPRVEDTINNITAVRQYNALSERAGLFDIGSPFGDEALDPLAPYSPRRGMERRARAAAPNTNNPVFRGTGPPLYYTRVGQFYPGVRSVGHGPNRNIAVMRSGRSGGMPSMPSMPSMPGPR
jgi:hypothetical protein